MKTLLIKIDNLINPLRKLSYFVASPVLDLSLRLYVGWAFFKSGKLRLDNYLNDDWGTQLFLFELEHPVPGVPANIAAPMTTIAEILLPILLFSGFFSRFAAAGLIVMTLVIEFTYQHNPDILIRTDHLVWLTMLSVIFIKGPGKLSLDHFFVKWLRKDSSSAVSSCPYSSKGKDESGDTEEPSTENA
jgi:putative oxidoreductase